MKTTFLCNGKIIKSGHYPQAINYKVNETIIIDDIKYIIVENTAKYEGSFELFIKIIEFSNEQREGIYDYLLKEIK